MGNRENMIDLTILDKLYSFSDQQLKNEVKPCKAKTEKEIKARMFENFERALLEGIRERKSTMLLLIESLTFISQVSGKDFQFSDLICEKLKDVHGEDFWEK